MYYLVTYGKSSGRIVAVSGRMTLRKALRIARNTPYLVDVVARVTR